RSTKLTPLTTRPSLTSRQGITRTLNIGKLLGRGARAADQRQCGRGINPAIIKRAARDRSGQLSRARVQQCLDVVDGGEAARGDDGNRYPFSQRNGRIQIEALQKPVACNVCKDDGGNAGILEPLRDFERGDPRGLCPAFDRNLAVTSIETHRHPAGKIPGRSLYEL